MDSGDLVDLSCEVRHRLDQAGLTETRIFASGDLDEFVIADLLARGAQIDAFDVGTALATSKDAPALGGVYKLLDVVSDEHRKWCREEPRHFGNIASRVYSPWNAKFSQTKTLSYAQHLFMRSKPAEMLA